MTQVEVFFSTVKVFQSKSVKNANPTMAKETNSICHQMGKLNLPATTQIIPPNRDGFSSLRLFYWPLFFLGR